MKICNLQAKTNNQRCVSCRINVSRLTRSIRKKEFVQGQSLFEVIIALAVSAMILTGIISLTSKSVSNATASKNKAKANDYAKEAIEFTRKEKEFTGWTSFKSTITPGGGNWCMVSLSFNNNFICNPSNVSHNITGTIFQRNLNAVESIANKSIDITATVRWTDEKGTHETETVSSISNW